MTSERRATVDVVGDGGEPLGSVGASVIESVGSTTAAIVAHGAGGTMDTPSIVSLQRGLSEAGVSAVRFNFLYSERKKKAPDRQPALVATWRAVADWTRRELSPSRLFLSGRSMGGRMASYLVAEGYPCDGLFFLAYPLHPPGKPERLRKDHLPGIEAPLLFVSGSRDAFARMDLLEPVVAETGATLHVVEGADHGFKVPKKFGRTSESVDAEVLATVLDFISAT